MSRNFQFGNDGDKTLGSIGYDFFDLFLSVETAVLRTFSVDTLRPYLRQFRILLDLDTPALIFGQMPVQAVDFEEG